MSETLPALSGPDQLDNIAQVEEANGLYINAETYRQLSREWRQTEADLERANQRIHEQTVALDKARAGVRSSIAQLQAVA